MKTGRLILRDQTTRFVQIDAVVYTVQRFCNSTSAI